MNIKKMISSFFSKEKQPEKVEDVNNYITFIMNKEKAIFVKSTLFDDELEHFLLILINNYELEYLLSIINDADTVQFQRIMENLKLRAQKELAQSNKEKAESDDPVIPVVFRNE